MSKTKLKKIINLLVISLFITSCTKGSDKIDTAKINESQSFFIIDNNVNLYSEKESSEVKKQMSFFEPVVVLSEDVSSQGRINVKLQDGTDGWVLARYTSFIPKNWKKLPLAENYYCYALTNKKIDLQRKDGEYNKGYYYINSEFEISMSIVFISDYKQDYINKQDTIKSEIEGGRDKKLNWNREFTIGNHKINYVITTDHPDGGISEMFDFVKLNEMNLQKYYYITFDYQPSESKEKILMQRKILFSVLQSLK